MIGPEGDFTADEIEQALEKNFIPADVHSADEVFVTGTFAGVIPVISVDGNKIGVGTCGTLTKNLQNWYVLDIDKVTSDL